MKNISKIEETQKAISIQNFIFYFNLDDYIQRTRLFLKNQ